MDFRIPARTEDYRRRIARFVEREVLPLESDPESFDEHENIRLDLLSSVRARAKREGLWCLQLRPEFGGQGSSKLEMAICYEAMNHSIFGPAAFNSAAPDDGNMMLLQAIGTREQQDWWLRPVADGTVRSAFAMTEPHPGSGSDPGMMLTTAERRGSDYVIRGRKWFITGAAEASHFIVMARTSDDPRRGLTAFLYHKDQPGWRIVRRIPIMGPEEHGGHCEIEYDNLVVPAGNVLLEEGQGLKVTQIRLGPARLTHCMRWLGLAKRCIAIAQSYAGERHAFGQPLADRESIQMLLGDLAMKVETGRLLVAKAAWQLDQGSHARKEISMAKVFVAQVLNQAADVAIQINGARGYSKDTILEWVYRYARQARLVDGADEVHRMVLNRLLAKDGGRSFWEWPTAEPLEATAVERVGGGV